MALPHIPLRIAVIQFAPKIGHVQANIMRAKELCSKLKPLSVDLVCLPEMIFTGYVFPNAQSIAPYLEHPRTGPTSRFCAELSERLRCYVAAGYPERLGSHELEKESDERADIQTIGANSAVLYGPTGELIGGYRKTNLFETDMTWAKAGTGFTSFNLPGPFHTVSLGICMDLNPQPPTLWTLATGPYEIADHCLATKSRLLILLNSWLDSENDPDATQDWHTLNYWAARLRPLWQRNEAECSGEDEEEFADDDEDSDEGDGDETIVVVCNRTGQENGKTFAGTSAAFALRQGSGRPKLLHVMNRQEEGLRVWTV